MSGIARGRHYASRPRQDGSTPYYYDAQPAAGPAGRLLLDAAGLSGLASAHPDSASPMANRGPVRPAGDAVRPRSVSHPALCSLAGTVHIRAVPGRRRV